VHFITFGGPYVGERGPLLVYRNRLPFKELVARASGRTELAKELARQRVEIQIARRNYRAQQRQATKETKQTPEGTEQVPQETKQAGEEGKQVTQEPRPQPQP